MAYWECYYHVVWATKGRAPLIDSHIEPVVFAKLREKSVWCEAPVLDVNGVEDHVHVAVCIPPKLAVAEWVRNVKGYVSREVNGLFPDRELPFLWQLSYGVLTFGQKQAPYVLEYIHRQKEHHADNRLQDRLERTDRQDSLRGE